ncbi:Uncharacterized protein conserved in archaea [Methanocella conradii HZ254]|uniref:Uncharacterized protein conserved in archaea n=1 Tax=Methanocella conradii (strain DSM 24694 / JCM 17849 / CGMCC 1.5162 / HZ254) TaxID=1041930 RepID=H8I608_METCZ|nr:MTH865 family protein [Methanocella conradii]AFD00242.1 Uncharacterized protein conserved in archaea [Methanocella conradii HZ254]
MVEKSTMIMGEEPSPEDIAELDNLKIQIVEQLRAADVKFPIRNKDELARVYPKGTRMSCTYKGKQISIHDLIPLIDDRVFPLENAGDTATALVSSCQLLK